jgi:hypothetical protein
MRNFYAEESCTAHTDSGLRRWEYGLVHWLSGCFI